MAITRITLTVALLAAGFAALVVIEAATFWLGERAGQHATVVAQGRELRVSAVALRNALLTAETSQRGFLYSGNEIYLAPFDGAKTSAVREVRELQADLERYPQLKEVIDQLAELVDAKIAEMDATVSLKREGGDAAALDLFSSNRGKALMDRVNVFVSGIVDAADKMLLDGVDEQVANAERLKWTALAGGLLIVIVVTAAIASFRKTNLEIAAARDEVRGINETLEQRVSERTNALKRALERSETLLSEVNHRVANSLSLVAALVRLQVRSSKDAAVKSALAETEARIAAIAAVHKRLYTSGNVGSVALDQYLAGLLEGLAATMKAEGHGASLAWDLESVELTTDATINVGVAVAELVTNAYKYAYPETAGEIRVRLKQRPEVGIELVVEDDGVGRRQGRTDGTGLGSRIVTSMAANLGTSVEYQDRQPGTAARIAIPV